MSIVEFLALIVLFVGSITFMVLTAVSQSRLAGKLDSLSEDRRMMREELTCMRERLKELETKNG